MAEIFAIVRGVMHMIQNGVCRRAILKRSNWFFLHFATTAVVPTYAISTRSQFFT